MDPFQDDSQSAGSGFDPMSLLRAFWRRKLLFLIPFILCLSMAVVIIRTMTPIYQSSGQLQIKFNKMNSSLLQDPSRRYGRARNIDAVAYHEMNMLLTSPEFLEIVVRELGLHDALRESFPDSVAAQMSDAKAVRRAMGRLRSMIKIKRDGDRLFRIAVRDPDPEQAYKLAFYIVDRFVEEYRATQMAASTSTRDFLERQLGIYQEDLEVAERALLDFQTNLASASLVDNPINAGNLSRAENNLAEVKVRYEGQDATELADHARVARGIFGSVPSTRSYAADPAVRSTISEMEDLGLEIQLFDSGDDRAQVLETRLGLLRVRLNDRLEELAALNMPQLSIRERNQVSQYIYFSLFRSGKKRIIDLLGSKIGEFRRFASRRPGDSARITELQNDVDRARGLVQTIEGEITQQTMNLEASLSEIGMQIKVRERPRLSRTPVEPDKMKLMALGGILSLGIGLGLVVLAIFLDRSFTTIDQIERTLGLQVIGTLPTIQDDHFENNKKVRILRWALIVLAIVAIGAVGFLVIYPRLS
ncbi:MAG: Wzz/FepE/Etk N-terminal domain-containing protein [Candidatus Krumholzibacteriota bacterium]